MTSTRISFLDGLKGLAAFWVLFHHYYLLTFPVMSQSVKQIESIPVLNTFVNGNFAVCLFLIVSGFLIAMSINKHCDFDSLKKLIIKRYFRLAIPIGSIFIFILILYYSNLMKIHEWSIMINHHMIENYFLNLKLKDFIFSVLFSPLGFSEVLGPCWMLKYIFIGTFIVVILSIALRGFWGGYKALIYVVAIILAWYISWNYVSIIVGMILFELWYNNQIPHKAWFSITLLLLSFYLPTIAHSVFKNIVFLNIISATCMLLSVFSSTFIQKIMASSFMMFLGKISLGVYLIHWPILCSISCWFFVKGFVSTPYLLINLLLSSTIVVLLSYLYTNTIEAKSNILVNKITGAIISNNSVSLHNQIN